MKKNCVILSFKRLDNDPRINRQAIWLQPHFHVSTLGPADTAISGVPALDSGMQIRSRTQLLWRGGLLALKRFEDFYWQTPHVQVSWAKLRAVQPQLIIANEIECLPLALRAQSIYGTRVLFDAHEFYPGLYEDRLQWRYLVQPYINYLCKKYISQANARITTCESMSEMYKRYLQIHDMGIVPNAPPYQDLKPSSNASERIRLIHHGLLIPDRKPEALLDMMRHLDSRFELTFMLVENDPQYIQQFKNKAGFSEHIHFIPAVPLFDIARTVSEYDMGVHIIPPTNRNNACMLPNKLFEFIQGRLAVGISPSLEMERLVKAHNLGVIAKDFSGKALAEAIQPLSKENIAKFKQNAHIASKILCAEESGKVFLNYCEKALSANKSV